MAKKYTNADLKSLKRDEIIELLKKNNIRYDSKEQSLFSLRKLLLDLEVEDEKPAEVELAVEEPVQAEVKEAEVKEAEPVEKTEEPKAEEPAAEKVETSAAFQSELSKRMATFGRATQSALSIELARRQGKVTGKISFAEELKIRQGKVRR